MSIIDFGNVIKPFFIKEPVDVMGAIINMDKMKERTIFYIIAVPNIAVYEIAPVLSLYCGASV